MPLFLFFARGNKVIWRQERSSLRATFFSFPFFFRCADPPVQGTATAAVIVVLLLLKIKPCATQSWLGARSNRASQMAMMFLYEMNAPLPLPLA